MEVDVLVYDTKDKTDFEFGGFYAPPVSAWKDRGWEVLDQLRNLWREAEKKCRNGARVPISCVRPDVTLESAKGDVLKHRVK